MYGSETADQDLHPKMIRPLTEKYGAVAADWESGAIAYVAHKNSAKCLIMRGVSDIVGPFDQKPSTENEIKKGTRTVMNKLLNWLFDWLLKADMTTKDE